MAQLDPQDWDKKVAQIVAKAWADVAFKQRLVKAPASILKEYGLEAPAGVEIRIVENTDKVTHLVLPPPPGDGELSEEDLASVAAGADSSICSPGGCGGTRTTEPVNPSGCWFCVSF